MLSKIMWLMNEKAPTGKTKFITVASSDILKRIDQSVQDNNFYL